MKNLIDCEEILREDKFLEDVYGAKSKLDNDVWLEAITKDGKWVFNAAELRKRLFDEAKVEVQHMK